MERVKRVPKNKWGEVENCNYVLKVCSSKHFKLHTVGMGGIDIQSRKKKYILALMWQMMSYHSFKVLASMGIEGREDQVINWANEQISKSKRKVTIISCK
jgi:hypothetical protein